MKHGGGGLKAGAKSASAKEAGSPPRTVQGAKAPPKKSANANVMQYLTMVRDITLLYYIAHARQGTLQHLTVVRQHTTAAREYIVYYQYLGRTVVYYSVAPVHVEANPFAPRRPRVRSKAKLPAV